MLEWNKPQISELAIQMTEQDKDFISPGDGDRMRVKGVCVDLGNASCAC